MCGCGSLRKDLQRGLLQDVVGQVGAGEGGDVALQRRVAFPEELLQRGVVAGLGQQDEEGGLLLLRKPKGSELLFKPALPQARVDVRGKTESRSFAERAKAAAEVYSRSSAAQRRFRVSASIGNDTSF